MYIAVTVGDISVVSLSSIVTIHSDVVYEPVFDSLVISFSDASYSVA